MHRDLADRPVQRSRKPRRFALAMLLLVAALGRARGPAPRRLQCHRHPGPSFRQRLRRARACRREAPRRDHGRHHSFPVAGERVEPGYPARQRHAGRCAAPGDPPGPEAGILRHRKAARLGPGKLGRRRRAETRNSPGSPGSRYTAGELERIARIAAEEGADGLSIGTELAKTTQRPEWHDMIAAARAAFPRHTVLRRAQCGGGRGRPVLAAARRDRRVALSAARGRSTTRSDGSP